MTLYLCLSRYSNEWRLVPWSVYVSQWSNWLSRQYGKLEIWVRIPAKAHIFSLKIIINSFEFYFFFCNFLRTTRADLEDQRRFADDSLSNAELENISEIYSLTSSILCTKWRKICTAPEFRPVHKSRYHEKGGNKPVHNTTNARFGSTSRNR